MKSKLNTTWSPADMKRTREMARRGLSARQAAELLGRSRGAVAYKAMVCGIRFKSIKQPAGVQRRPAQRRKLSRLTKQRHALAA